MYRNVLILLLLFFVAETTISAQEKSVMVLFSDSGDIKTTLEKTINKTISQNIGQEKNYNYLLLNLYKQGHLTANIDSISTNISKDTLHITAGPIYKLTHLLPGNLDGEILNYLNYSQKLFFLKPFNYQEIEKLLNKSLQYYENNGYPFATVKLDSIEIKDYELAAKINLTKNQKVTIDSILIKGSKKINPVFIFNYIAIKPGDLYDESKITKIKSRLNELAFLTQSKPLDISFGKAETKLNLYLEDKKASQFNGILGVLPDDKNPSKILFTGDAFFKLQNTLGRGELFEFNWRKLQTQTQELKIQFVYPFILNTPFGIDYKLDIYKKDTTFLSVNNNLGVQYWLKGGNYLKAFVQSKNSVILSTKDIENKATLSQNADINSTYYGLEIKKENYDYRYNPRKGYAFVILGSAGTRKIIKNPKLNQAIYNDLNLKTAQYSGEFNIDYFIPFFSKTTLKLSTKSSFLLGDKLFKNELFRIGGLKTLRGFDEESIFASSYTILNIEYRYLLEQNSYLHAFWNGAYYQTNIVNQKTKDTPYGFGLGISFESKPGIFSISYALGKQFNNPILIKAGKVHFGFVSYF